MFLNPHSILFLVFHKYLNWSLSDASAGKNDTCDHRAIDAARKSLGIPGAQLQKVPVEGGSFTLSCNIYTQFCADGPRADNKRTN